MNFRQSFRPSACCAIALLAPFLGGSTERWSQGIVLLLLSLLVSLLLPRSWGPPAFAGAALLLAALAAVSFLPASWFAMPSWRERFLADGIRTGPLLSPQPWISAECAILLLAGLLWIYWLASQEWGPGERRWMAGVFVAGAALLAAVALVAFFCGRQVPFWHSERGFGPFPNRNQSGDFFAVSGILAMGCACEWFREKKFAALWFVLAAAVIGAALVMSYSRAAVVLFFAGSVLWIASLGLISRSVKSLALSAALLMVLAAAFLLFGGATLERFRGGSGITWGFRRLVTRDVFLLIHSSPWCGIGLGNFEGVFASFRNESAMPSRVIHPESDWLWLWSEMGLSAVFAVLAGAALLFGRVAPLGRGTDRRLRLAAAAAALIFAMHGLVDVSGHRLGSALPGLFVLGLAINNPAAARKDRRASFSFRLLAVIPGVAGAVWLCAVLQGRMLPSEIGVASAIDRAQKLVAQKEYAAAGAVSTRAVAWAPLDWRLYFIRGTARAYHWNSQGALDDFRRVEILESTSPLVTFDEGRVWLSCDPLKALPPWRESLRRSVPHDAPQLYSRMLDYASPDPALRRALHALTEGQFDLELVYIRHSAPGEAVACINSVLRSDPALHSLDDARKTAFFRVWAENGGADDLVRRLAGNPSWQPLAWRQAAAGLASRGDFEGACGWAFRFLPHPPLPEKPSGDAAELRRRLSLRPDDYAAGYALYAALVDQKDEAGALKVLRGVTAQPGCPVYFHYLEAGLEFRLGDFPAAWGALQKYGPVANE